MSIFDFWYIYINIEFERAPDIEVRMTLIGAIILAWRVRRTWKAMARLERLEANQWKI